MESGRVGSQVYSIPRPRLRLARWLSAPIHVVDLECDDELRASMFRRIEAVLASAFITLIVIVLAVMRHPTFGFHTWLAVEACLCAVRAPLAIHILYVQRQSGHSRRFHPWSVDLFIIAGTIWSATLGFGCFISLQTQDPGLAFLIGLVATGTASGQCARNPSSPRLNSVQMCLIIFPFTIGACCSDIPLVGWCMLLSPLYLTGMLSISLQLHEDYVTMILARMEDRRRALHCALTGLPNRVLFNDSLALRFETALATRKRVAVLCLDLDGFKAVNDEFGHPMGDALLRQVADRLSDILQGDGIVARFGGDEFAILMCGDDDLGAAKRLASRIIAAIARPFALTVQHEARIGVSIGIAVGMGSARLSGLEAGADLLAKADHALYAAKRGGRGDFRVYDDNAIVDTGTAKKLVADARASIMRKAS